MKTKTVSQLKKLADKYFSKYVRYRDGRKSTRGWETVCITCNQWKPSKEAQAGHFVRRSVSLLRFDEENVNGQCVGCNVFKYGDQYAYARALDLKYGDGTAERLHDQRFTTHKFTITELESIIDHAKEQIKFYEGQL